MQLLHERRIWVVHEPQGSALWCHFRSSFLSKGGVPLHAVHAVHAVLFAITRIYWLSTVGEYLKGTEFVKQLKRYLQGLWFTKFKDPTRTCRLWRYLGKWLKVPYSLWSAKCGTKKKTSHHSFVSSVWSQHFWCGFRQMRWLLRDFHLPKAFTKRDKSEKAKQHKKQPAARRACRWQRAKTQKCDKCSWGTSWKRCFCIQYSLLNLLPTSLQ